MEEKNEKKPLISTDSIYAGISFFISILLGCTFIYLFCWKEPGISHLIYYVAMLLAIIIPVFVVEKKNAIERFKTSGLILVFTSFLPLIFLYRLNESWIAFAFIILPIIFGISFSALFSNKTYKNFGIFSFITLPAILFISWFGDTFKFLRKLSFGGIKNPKTRSYLKRVITGLIVVLPFVLLVLVLLSSADQMFSKFIADFFKNTFGEWFKDAEATISTITKLFVGGCISVYSMVYLFSLWNKESVLHSFMSKNGDRDVMEAKKNWDVIVTAVFMGALNIIFILFVVVQIKYMFGGEANVLGSGADFSYAEYARKGFTELLFVSLLVYAIVLVMNLKVYTANLLQKFVFRGNFIIMILCAVVINYSAFQRILLYESVYGFTNLRLIVNFAIGVVTVLYLCLLISSLLKNPWKFINTSSAVIISLVVLAFLSVPNDAIVTELNYIRYKDNQKIDVPYITTLSDEAIPAIVKIVKDESVDASTSFLLKADLEKRYERIKEERTGWQSYNVANQYNKILLEETLGENSSWRANAETYLEQYLEGYEEMIESGDYEEAYNQYWSEYTEMLDLSDLSEIRIVKYDIKEIPDYQDWNVVNTFETSQYDYWSGLYVDVDFEYEVRDSSGVWRKQCTYEYLTMIVEDGQWKVKYASALSLGNFKDGGSRVDYFENSSLDYLTDYSEYSSCGESYFYGVD